MNGFKLSIPVLAMVLLLLNGCTDSLNEQTFSNITTESHEFSKNDFPSAIGPVYSNMRGLTGFFNYFTQEITSDELVQPANASGWDDGGIYKRMHQHQWSSEQPHVGALWGMLYQGVIHSNRVINNLNSGNIKVPDEIGKEAAIAEIRAVRAFYYWLILDNFGDAPLTTKTTSESQELPSKTPREEIYRFVVEELTQSIPSLSTENNQKLYGRFNRWVAQTVLASVYLNAEVYTGEPQWDKALQHAQDVIDSGMYRLDTEYGNPFKTRNQGSGEIIFAIPFDNVNAGGFNIHLISFHASLKEKFDMKATPWGAGSAKAVPQFGAIYDTADVRLDETWLRGIQITPEGDTLEGQYEDAGKPLNFTRKMKNGLFTSEDAGWRVGKWDAYGADTNLNNDFAVFRYARVLMIKAEALLRTGNSAEAAAIVSRIRDRAFPNNPTKAQVSGNDLTSDSEYDYGYWENFEIVDEGNTDPVEYGGFLDELGREFAGEMYRRRDLIRFGIFTKKSWLSKKASEDFRTVFPIPNDVVNSNPNLQQHSSY